MGLYWHNCNTGNTSTIKESGVNTGNTSTIKESGVYTGTTNTIKESGVHSVVINKSRDLYPGIYSVGEVSDTFYLCRVATRVSATYLLRKYSDIGYRISKQHYQQHYQQCYQ